MSLLHEKSIEIILKKIMRNKKNCAALMCIHNNKSDK